MINLFEQLIHPSLLEDHTNRLKSKVVSLSFLLLLPISIIYAIMFPHDIFQFAGNFITIFSSLIGLYFLKKKGNIIVPGYILLIFGYISTTTTALATGGFYSMDVLWYMTISFGATILIKRTGGVIITSLIVCTLAVFYYLNHTGIYDFKTDSLQNDPVVDFTNLFIIFFFAALMAYLFFADEKVRTNILSSRDKELKALDDTYKFITQNAADIISIRRLDGKIEYISPSIKDALGYEQDEIIGKYKSKVMPLHDLDELLEAKSQHSTTQYYTKAGEAKWYDITSKVIQHEDSNEVSILTIARDVTEQMDYQEQMLAMREKVARDFHDEMGNKLAAITLNSEILLNTIQGAEDSTIASIENIKNNSKDLYQGSRDFIWAIGPDSDLLQEAFYYLRDFGYDLLQPLGMSLDIETKPSDIPNLRMPTFYGRQIILIFKEIMTNAVKHSECENALLQLNVSDQNIEISFKEDGKGFDEATLKKSRGLKNMRYRAEQINGQIEIESKVGEGTFTKLILDRANMEEPKDITTPAG